MRKNYIFGILFLFFGLLNGFSSFGQNPVANNDNDVLYFSPCESTGYVNVNIFWNDVAPNGFDYSSVDLNMNMSGIQNFYDNGNGTISYGNNGYVSVSLYNVSDVNFQYTFQDNLGNLSNVGTISVFTISPYISYSMINNIVNYDNPNSGKISFTLLNLNATATFELYRSSGNGPVLYSTDIVPAGGGSLAKENLPYGVYSYKLIMSCGVQIISTDDYQRSIWTENPLVGIAVGTYVDYNNSGIVDVGDIINYHCEVTNTCSTCTMNDVNVNEYGITPPTPIPSIGPGVTATIGSLSHIITQTNINNGYAGLWGGYITSSSLPTDPVYLTTNTFSQVYTQMPLNISSAIKLNAFIDTNNNGIQDGVEVDYTNGTFSYQINSGVVHNLNSPLAELYLYETNPANVYNLTYTINANNSFCGAQYTVATTAYPNVTVANGSGITTYNFPITTVPCTDVSVNLIQNSVPRPGFEFQNLIKYKNEGNQVASGTITFSKDASVSISNTTPFIPTNSGGFIYNYTNLQPDETRTISVNILVPNIPIVSLGQIVTNYVTITPTDTNMPNNSDIGSQIIIGAYDPNDKTESHGGKILHSSFTANDYLNYTIRFENTGTAEAINIKVEDVLDSKLDETSIRMVASSHPYILDRVGSNLKWNFNGVNLPPSTPASSTIGHGYITFQVKPKPGFAVGDIIPNTANIYFDFNPAIVTNTCTTEFVSTLANENFRFNNFKSFPNPVKNSLTISNTSPIETIEISSILGQKMISKKVNDIQTEIDLSQLSKGIYFVKVTSQGNEKTIKIIKE